MDKYLYTGYITLDELLANLLRSANLSTRRINFYVKNVLVTGIPENRMRLQETTRNRRRLQESRESPKKLTCTYLITTRGRLCRRTVVTRPSSSDSSQTPANAMFALFSMVARFFDVSCCSL